ncbi:MAG: hypothetical protein KTR22_14015 [Flavobacteriaceae bacterium]|nr:hypothetical protein [Flavobacteriaceae bacterium]
MINTFLKAKHWQLFIIMIGIPLVFQFVFMGSIIFTTFDDTANFEDVLSPMTYFPFIMIIFMVVFFGWFWSMGIGLQKFIPEDLRLNTGKFKFFLIFPFIYIILFLALFMGLFMNIDNLGFHPGISISFIFPLHLFAMFCMFYQLYFVAKTIKTVELQREVTFSDYAGEFFLLWFYMIGIWIIQPKLNKFVSNPPEQPLIEKYS